MKQKRKKKKKKITVSDIPGLFVEDIVNTVKATNKGIEKMVNILGDGVYHGIKTIFSPFSDKKKTKKIQKKSN